MVRNAFRNIPISGYLLVVSVLLATIAQAASTDVVFRGGATVTSTSGCTGWNPDKQFFVGTYWVPVSGSTNGPDSVVNFLFPGGGGEGFQLNGGVLTTAYKSVRATHIYTRNGNYTASMRVTARSPATITKTTQRVWLAGSVKRWDQQTNCIVNFQMNLLREPNP